MRIHPRLPAAFLLVLTVSACAANQQGGGQPRGDRSMITRAQLDEQHYDNAYDAVAALHSIWLETRGTDSFNTPSQVWVYVDNTRFGDVTSLRALPANTIAYIQHYDANQATARWGIGHGAGVIFVATMAGGKAPDPRPETTQDASR